MVVEVVVVVVVVTTTATTRQEFVADWCKRLATAQNSNDWMSKHNTADQRPVAQGRFDSRTWQAEGPSFSCSEPTLVQTGHCRSRLRVYSKH